MIFGVSGGWNPNIHISCHTGVKPEWNNKILAFTPGKKYFNTFRGCGSANGKFTLTSVFMI